MKFGEVALTDARGALLAHGLKCREFSFRKGRVLDGGDLEAIARSGRRTVVVVRLDADDVSEDAAASALARAVAGSGLRVSAAATGRANLYATQAGLAVFDTERVDAVNRVDEVATIATLPPFAKVQPRQLVATIKIIPFAVPRSMLDAALSLAESAPPLLRIAPFRPLCATLIQTQLPGMRRNVLAKTVQVTRARLASVGGELVDEVVVAHTADAVGNALALSRGRGIDLVLVLGASAVVDRCDVIPTAMQAAGGRVDHFGMPVDPGNLLLFGSLGETPVIGLPGCARSPKLNGFDWVLQRVAAGLPVGREQIMGMGVGGLLSEIPSRPLPRQRAAPDEVQA